MRHYTDQTGAYLWFPLVENQLSFPENLHFSETILIVLQNHVYDLKRRIKVLKNIHAILNVSYTYGKYLAPIPYLNDAVAVLNPCAVISVHWTESM